MLDGVRLGVAVLMGVGVAVLDGVIFGVGVLVGTMAGVALGVGVGEINTGV